MTVRSVTLSVNLKIFLAYADYASIRGQITGRGILGAADQILKDASDEDLQDKCGGSDGWEPFSEQTILIGTTPMNTNRLALNEEFFALLDEWGPLYPIDSLLNADEHKLSTQMRVEDIQPGNGFEQDGVKGSSGTIRQHQVLQVGYEMEGVPHRVTIGDRERTEHTVLSMPKGTLVRPLHVDGHFGPNCHGSPFRDPEDFVRFANDRDEYRVVSDAMYAAVEEAIDGEVHACFSAYDTKDNGTPINNLNELATTVHGLSLEGPVVFVAASDRDDEDGFEDYESPIQDGGQLTWLAVTVLFNESIKTAGDYHHSFLEGLYFDKKASEKRGTSGVKVVRFSTGS